MKPFLKYSIWTKLFTHWLYWKISFVRLSNFFFLYSIHSPNLNVDIRDGLFPFICWNYCKQPIRLLCCHHVYLVFCRWVFCQFLLPAKLRCKCFVVINIFMHVQCSCTWAMRGRNEEFTLIGLLRSVWTKFVTFTEVHLQFFKILT